MFGPSIAERDELLRRSLARLAARFPASPWVASSAPYTALCAECLILTADPVFSISLKRYLAERAILRRAITSFFTYIAMAARANWNETQEAHRGIVARGWFLGRWLPTFLVIDGPIGRFFCSDGSPLYARLGSDLPILSAACELLGDKTFYSLRNAFAHWAFDWEVVDKDSYIVAYNWDKDLPIAKLHLEEADAYHLCAFAIIEVIDHILISERAFDDAAT